MSAAAAAAAADRDGDARAAGGRESADVARAEPLRRNRGADVVGARRAAARGRFRGGRARERRRVAL